MKRLGLLKKGFTLIELLVVITIIGILATGATTTYTSQIQKARDATRVNDMKALQGGIEQMYQDKGTYPNAGLAITSGTDSFTGVKVYTPKLPVDPKTGQKSTNSSFDYTYGVASDANGIAFQAYEVSTTFENSGNITEKAGKDAGTDSYRLEEGIKVDLLVTGLNIATPVTTWAQTTTIPASSCTTNAAGTTTGPCPTANPLSQTNVGALVIR